MPCSAAACRNTSNRERRQSRRRSTCQGGNTTMTEPYRMPPSMRCGVSVYAVSDETGLEVAFEFTGAPEFDPARFDELIKVACSSLNLVADVTDARPMTADEVAAYIE